MKRIWLSPIVAFACLVILAALAAAGPASTTSWTLVVPSQVPQDAPIPIGVVGPSGTGFSIALYAQPFNSSKAVFNYNFVTPSNSSGVGTLNVSIPSRELELGPYEVVLSTTTTENVSSGIVNIVNDFNVTQFEQNMTYIFGEIAGLQAAAINEANEINTQSGEIDELRAAVVFVSLILVVYVPVSEWSRRNPGAVHSIPEFWRNRHQKREMNRWGEEQPGTISLSPDGYITEDTGLEVTRMRAFDPGRVWVSDKCVRCTVLEDHASKVAHLTGPSPPGHAMTSAEDGVDLWKDEAEMERQSAMMRPEPTGKPRKQTWRIDLGTVR
jgi:hypothetical protein